MKRGREALKTCLYLLIVLGMFLSFQNCAQNSSGKNFYSPTPKQVDYSSIAPPDCIPDELCTPKPDSVQLSSLTQSFEVSGFVLSAMSSSNPGMRVVDISGFCDLGNYPKSVFSYRVTAPSYILEKAFAIDEIKCEKEGRFRFQIPMDPATVSNLISFDLEIVLTPVDSRNTLVRVNGTANVLKRYIVYSP